MQSKIRVIKKAKKNNSRNLFCYLYTFFHQWAKYLNCSSMCHSLLYQASSSLKPWISCYNGGGVRVRGACHFRTFKKKVRLGSVGSVDRLKTANGTCCRLCSKIHVCTVSSLLKSTSSPMNRAAMFCLVFCYDQQSIKTKTKGERQVILWAWITRYHERKTTDCLFNSFISVCCPLVNSNGLLARRKKATTTTTNIRIQRSTTFARRRRGGERRGWQSSWWRSKTKRNM